MCVPFMIIIQFRLLFTRMYTRQHSIVLHRTPHVLPCVQTNIKNEMRRVETNAPTSYIDNIINIHIPMCM